MIADRSRVTWHDPRILGILVLIFMCGALSGALAYRYRSTQVIKAAGKSWIEGGKQLTLNKLSKELALDAQQAAEVEAVLDDFMMYYQSLQSQMDEVRANGKGRILRVLTPDQRVRFEQMLSDIQDKLK